MLPALVGKFYDQQSYTDVSFVLADGSTVQVKTPVSLSDDHSFDVPGSQTHVGHHIFSVRGNVLRTPGRQEHERGEGGGCQTFRIQEAHPLHLQLQVTIITSVIFLYKPPS